MAAALRPDNRNRIDANRLGLERIAHGGNLVDHLDAGGFQRRQVRLRIAAGGFDELHPLLDNQIENLLGLFALHQLGQHGHVDAEGFAVAQIAALANFIAQLGQFGKRRRRDKPD